MAKNFLDYTHAMIVIRNKLNAINEFAIYEFVYVNYEEYVDQLHLFAITSR